MDRALELQRLASDAWNHVHHLLGTQHQDLVRPVASPPTDLTPRETQVVTLMGSGMSNRSIARHLRISERTVKSHLHSIFTKLGVTTRGEAAAHLNNSPVPGWMCPKCPAAYRRAEDYPPDRIREDTHRPLDTVTIYEESRQLPTTRRE
ncbi:response regulator transcription factor [Actinosynnema sp. CA-299493]